MYKQQVTKSDYAITLYLAEGTFVNAGLVNGDMPSGSFQRYVTEYYSTASKYRAKTGYPLNSLNEAGFTLLLLVFRQTPVVKHGKGEYPLRKIYIDLKT